MIQRSLLLFAASALGLQSFAQPTLTQANNAPVPGDIFSISSSAADSILTSAGASQLFGCWMLEEASARDIKYIDPSETTSSDLMTDEDVLSTDGGSDTLFWNTDATGLYLVGERTLATFPYTDAVKELVYPCTFGTTWTDNGSAAYTVAGINAVRTVSVTGNADAYGTLELPVGPIDNVLRVSVRRTSLDQSAFLNVDRVTHITYFFVDTVQYPILKLQMDTVILNGGAPSVTYSNEWMYGPGTVGLTDLSSNEIAFAAYPNPVAELLSLPVTVKGAARCDVLDAAGRVVLSRQLNASNTLHQIAVNGLPAGLYTARITDQQGLHTARFQVAR
ncbi:MAG: T9SS type A sorting domain-containing protein [Flavobacteriales bacterium]|nr:T9SS type A sorting domain-containing protein [Flavobacteriales bacterium]